MSDLSFGDHLTELSSKALPKPAQDPEAELFGNKSVNETILNFERQLGLLPPPSIAKNSKSKNKILRPERDADAEFLNDLYNNPKYQIIYYKDTWTAHGEYRVFVRYLEFETKEEPKKLNEEEPTTAVTK